MDLHSFTTELAVEFCISTAIQSQVRVSRDFRKILQTLIRVEVFEIIIGTSHNSADSKGNILIAIECQSCGKKIKASDKHAGKRVKCPNCSNTVTIPTATPAVDPPAVSEPAEPAAAEVVSPPVAETEMPVIDTAAAATPTPPPTAPSDDAPSFDFPDAAPAPTSVASSYAKRRKRGSMMPMILGGGIFIAGVMGFYWFFVVGAVRPLNVHTIENQTRIEGEGISVMVNLFEPPSHPVKYLLQSAPDGASINAKTGKITWLPTEADGPGDHQFKARVQSVNDPTNGAEVNFSVTVLEKNEAPAIEQIAEQTAKADVPVRLVVEASDSDIPANELQFELSDDAPETADIDATSGAFQWTPTRDDRGKTFNITVTVRESGDEGLHAEQNLRISVEEGMSPAQEFVASLKAADIDVEYEQRAVDSVFAGKSSLLVFKQGVVQVFEYDSARDAGNQAAEVSPDAKLMFGGERKWETPAHFFHKGELIAVYEGEDPTLVNVLTTHMGNTFAVAKPVVTTTPTVVTTEKDPDIEKLVSLYKEVRGRKKTKRLFLTSEYKDVRKVFAERFERQNSDKIQFALGDDYDAMQEFFAEHTDLKEEFYTAIDPKHDNLGNALKLLKQLIDKYPKEIDRYGPLAIATAVVWDGSGVYNYSNHQRRCKASMPAGQIAALDNFQYFLDAEQVTQGKVQYLPWEFLTLLVDHRTPVNERQWALQNYLSKSAMFGKCYHDVPYDFVMLETKSQQAALNDKEYNLPNIRQFGGVCAMQADFAARVGKSIAVPAAYVTGNSSSGEGHAWVMWVELKGVSRTNISFTLESHGRYRGDKFYVGTLRDPQTGRQITDRQLELKLQTVGLNPMAKRQAVFAMKAYPMLLQELRLGVSDRLKYLSDVISLCPGNTDAWTAVAKISGEEDLIPKDRKQVSLAMVRLFRTFANVPDFTLTVFSDLIGFEDDDAEKIKYYEQLIGMYLSAGRPDLAFAARKQQIVLLVKNNRTPEAIEALAATIRRFPEEGRYVPGMLNQLEQLAASVEGSDQNLMLFYKAFLPTIPQMRGNRPSKYCVQTFERAIKLFQEKGQQQLAQGFQAELEKIKAGMGRKVQK
ncbi:MAG: hypothetical protein CMJ78_25795 [Planctomycetaceae bacterium]|nr:hypothetical protein [Planctomycetaceae bacterium]